MENKEQVEQKQEEVREKRNAWFRSYLENVVTEEDKEQIRGLVYHFVKMTLGHFDRFPKTEKLQCRKLLSDCIVILPLLSDDNWWNLLFEMTDVSFLIAAIQTGCDNDIIPKEIAEAIDQSLKDWENREGATVQ